MLDGIQSEAIMSSQTETTKPGLLLSDDLMFTSRITGTARGLRLEVRQVRALDRLVETAEQVGTRCVILDLAFPGLDLAGLMRRLGELESPPRVVAYGSHVDAASLQAARAAGCNPTLPRSKFVEDLGRELPHWLAGPE
jgi:DNA-binding NarL/FixJ family response regulator